MSGFVYILRDDSGRYYIGSTNDPDRRMYQHSLGLTKTTARMNNPKIVFIQKFNSISDARKIELWIKKFKRRDFIDKIVRDGFINKK